jgi:hypothetical protein
VSVLQACKGNVQIGRRIPWYGDGIRGKRRLHQKGDQIVRLCCIQIRSWHQRFLDARNTLEILLQQTVQFLVLIHQLN